MASDGCAAFFMAWQSVGFVRVLSSGGGANGGTTYLDASNLEPLAGDSPYRAPGGVCLCCL